MRTIKVKLGSRSYEIRIGQELLPQVGQWLREIAPANQAVIITNPVAGNNFVDILKRGLTQAAFKLTVLVIPDGEEQKTLATAGKLYSELAGAHTDRSTPLIALGGGVVGDLAGFVAATYMRGIPLIQIPTTLLAQVDSSVGGKTAVDHGRIKNSIGVFYQPILVIADITTLRTLPKAELSNGLAEVIKYAVIRDRSFFSFLEKNIDKIRLFDSGLLEEIVARSDLIKSRIVEKDERDTGLRNILNYGHTIGHAVESVSDFRIKHGQAVAMGMVSAARIANKLGIFRAGHLARLENLILRAGLPIDIPGLNIASMITAMEHDKKIVDGKIKFVLPQSIGKVFVSDQVSLQTVKQVLGSKNEEG